MVVYISLCPLETGIRASLRPGVCWYCLAEVALERTPYGLQDVEQVRLVLNGHSVIDWRRLAMRDLAHADQLLSRQGVWMSQADDVARLNQIHEMAVDYVLYC